MECHFVFNRLTKLNTHPSVQTDSSHWESNFQVGVKETAGYTPRSGSSSPKTHLENTCLCGPELQTRVFLATLSETEKGESNINFSSTGD